MPMYNLLEYSDNYEESSGSPYQFKRDEQNLNNDGNIADVTADNSTSFKYKSGLLNNAVVRNNNAVIENAKIAVPLKYISNFFRLLEMPLINCKFHLELNWTPDCVMCNIAGDTKFQITNTKLYVPIVTLSFKDNTELVKKGFKRLIHWNEYKMKPHTKNDDNTFVKIPLDPSFHGVNRLFVLDFNRDGDNVVTEESHKKYFLPRVNITEYNVLIDGRNFCDQPISSQIRKYDEVRRVALGKGDYYTTGCLLDCEYFKKYYQIIAVDLSK